MRLLLLVLTVVAAARIVSRTEPSDWFTQLILEDQRTGDHDHSGSTQERHNHTCCHRITFSEDPVSGDDLVHVSVPYNHWWQSGATLFALVADPGGESPRMLALGRDGLMLDFRQHARLYLRIQCAYACCLEGAAFMLPPGAPRLDLLAQNASGFSAAPRPVARGSRFPPGAYVLGGHVAAAVHQEVLWDTADARHTRLEQLHMCDYDAAGMWLRMDSINRIEAALAELDVCFVHHDMAMAWDNGLCEEA